MADPATTQVVESEHRLHLAGRSLPYVLRRTARSRGLRVTIDPRRGVVVTIPPSSRRGWARPDERVESFLRERERWIVRHLTRLEREWTEIEARGSASDGGLIHYRGELHRIRDEVGSRRPGRSIVERVGGADGDELVIQRGARDRRPASRIIEAWLRTRAAEAIDRAVAEHAAALRVTPSAIALRDPRTRWGSASRAGRLMFSWRLILAPPGALETVVVHELAHLRVFGHGPKFWALVASRRPDHLADRAWLRRNSHALHASLEVGAALDVA
jgi:predicted metal-dependent hydrolase